MEKTKHIVIALVLVLFVTGTGISEESQMSNTRQANCIIKITINTDITPLSLEDIDNIIHSSNVMGKAAREILDTTPATVIFLPDSQISGQGKGNQMTYSWHLNIELPESIRPAANEFVKAIVDNLKISLDNIYAEYFNEYIDQLNLAQRQYDEAEDILNELKKQPRLRIIPVSPEIHAVRTSVHKQLEEKVDLPEIHPDMSLSEILEILRNSVDPPLQIQPNWRNLVDTAEIDRETLCEMEPLTGIKLGKALDILLESLSNDYADLGYIIEDGVITIATKDTLPNKMVTVLYEISGFLIDGRTSSSFIVAIEETIEPESWYDLDETGEGMIVDVQGGTISVRNTPEVQEKITNFLIDFPVDFPDESVANIPVEMLQADKQGLERQRRQLEMEVARLEARQSTAEQQIIAVSSKVKDDTNVNDLKIKLALLLSELEVLKNTRTEQHPEVQAIQNKIDEIKVKIASIEEDPIISELERFIENQTQQLKTLKLQIEVGQMPLNELAAAEEKLMQAKIQIAKRREELARPAGVGNLSTLNENLSMTVLDLAEKKAELQVVNKQLSEIEGRIRAASTTDPDILKFRQTQQALDRAVKRLSELKRIDENRQPPKVITIGI